MGATKCPKRLNYNPLYNKRVCPTKNEPQQQGLSYLEREGVGEKERGRWAGLQAGKFKVRLGLGDMKR